MNTVVLLLLAVASVVAGGAMLWAMSQPEPKRIPVRRLEAPRDRRRP